MEKAFNLYPLTVNMPTVEINGTAIYYETTGSGSPIVLINGWGGNLDSWSDRMIEFLTDKHLVIMLDNRGTGRSGKPDVPYSMKVMSADVVGVLEAVGVEKAHVLGFSMGGAITQHVGLNYPDRVRSLIICGASPGGANSVSSEPWVQMDLALIANPLPEMTMRDVTIKLLYLLYSKEYVDENLEELILDETYSDYPTPSYTLIRQSEAIAGHNTLDKLPELEVPVLVLTGEDDILVPPLNSEKIASAIQDSKLVKIPGSGHGFLKQKTEEVVQIIIDFLSSVDEI